MKPSKTKKLPPTTHNMLVQCSITVNKSLARVIILCTENKLPTTKWEIIEGPSKKVALAKGLNGAASFTRTLDNTLHQWLLPADGNTLSYVFSNSALAIEAAENLKEVLDIINEKVPAPKKPKSF